MHQLFCNSGNVEVVSKQLINVTKQSKEFTVQNLHATLDIIDDILNAGLFGDGQAIESNIINVISNVLDSSGSTLHGSGDGKASNR